MATKKKAEKKIFVLDTNIPLHDPFCLMHFAEHDVEIPIHIIEEIDQFKKGFESINLNAREFSRKLDELSCDKIFNGGVSLGDGLGSLKIALDRPFHEKVKANLTQDSMDNRIINIAFGLKEENPGIQVVLVSKDTNVRLKAKALGILSQDFLHEKVADVDFLSQGIKTVKVTSELIKKLYKDKEVIHEIKGALPNQNFILNSNSDSSTAIVRYFDGTITTILKDKMYAFNLKPKNSEQAFAMDALLNRSIELVTIEGSAGTGKTIISLACALQQIDKDGLYDQISFGRKIMSVGNSEIGFLPGDAKDKMDPFMGGMKDNLDCLSLLNSKEKKKIEEYIQRSILTVEALGFIRGRSLSKKFFIIDEAQNLTPHEVKTILTRAGEGTKVVFIGDTHQIDSPYLDQRSNGFSYLIQKFLGQSNYSHIHLLKSERSHLAEQAGKLL